MEELYGLLLAGGGATVSWVLSYVSDGLDYWQKCPKTKLGVASDEVKNTATERVPETTRRRLPPPKHGDKITVLSIDGGGIRGIIPSVVLTRLEELLQVR